MLLEVIARLALLGLGVAISPVAVIAAILLLVSPGGRSEGGAVRRRLGRRPRRGRRGRGRARGRARHRRLGRTRPGSRPSSPWSSGVVLLVFGVMRWRGRPGTGRRRTDARVDGEARLRHDPARARPGRRPGGREAEEPRPHARRRDRDRRADGLDGRVGRGPGRLPGRRERERRRRRWSWPWRWASERIRSWSGGRRALVAHNKAIMAVVFLVFGLLLVGKGVTGIV